MRAELTHRYRKARKAVADALEGRDRFVDMGIVLRVVRQDPNGKRVLRGKPKVTILREHEFGGWIDTAQSPPRLIGRSSSPVVIYTDEVGEPIALHGDELPPNILLEGAMRAGKTSTGVTWLGLRVLESTGTDGEWGCTAPTTKRLGEVKRALMETFPKSWWTWKERDGLLQFRNGVTVRLVSTHQASAAEGSPIQAFSWLGSLNDELQDSLHVDEDIEARGSEAGDGKAKRLATCTVKDASDYRTWKARVLKSGYWFHARKAGTSNPFIPPEFWIKLKSTMTAQGYARRAEAKDVPSEKLVYFTFSRENLRPVPAIGARDVTARELQQWGRGMKLLLCHDPGRIYHVTEILQAWQVPGTQLCIWWVVGEVTNKRSTLQQHVRDVAAEIRRRWQALPAEVQVIGDPHTKWAPDDHRPNVQVATIWRQGDFNYAPAAYKPNSTEASVVPKNARIEMVNILWCNADNERRLMIACNDHGEAAAPRLLEAVEELETDEAGYAERDKKDENDKTHWPCAVGLGLWPIEQPRIDDQRKQMR